MIITDANVLLYRILQNPRQPDARALARFDSHWAAPLLWRSEVRSGLVRHMRAGHITIAQADAAIQFAATCLIGGEYAVTDHDVFSLVAQSKCSAYDCEYVALAEEKKTILITEDQALLKAFPQRCRSIKQVI